MLDSDFVVYIIKAMDSTSLPAAPRGQQGQEKKVSNKITVVVGHKTTRPENWDAMSIDERHNSWKTDSFHRSGYWKKETIAALARKLGFIDEIKVAYTRMDYSGKGRTYNEREESIAL